MLISLIDAPRRWLRSLYDWTLRWAQSGRSLSALFWISVAESSFFPIPPDVLLTAIVAARPARWWRAASLASSGSVLGGMVGYGIGSTLMATLGNRIVDFYGMHDHWVRVVQLYRGEWGILFLLAAAFTPIPYKVATIAAGATNMPFWPFVGVSAVGRSARFFLVAALLRMFGAPARRLMEAHFDKVAIALFVLLVAGFAVIGYL